MNKILQAEDVKFKEIIDYPPIEIEEGKITFICGDSGCGKSTLLKLFNGTESPASGKVLYRGEDIAPRERTALRKEVLLVSQSPYLFDRSIRDNFLEFSRYRELPPPSEEEMERFLKLCCISFSVDQDCTSLSGGERQRVFLAIFLSFRPKVLLLDEPTAALDRASGLQMIGNICKFCREQGITPVIVSHDMEVVDAYSERKIVLKRGQKGE